MIRRQAGCQLNVLQQTRKADTVLRILPIVPASGGQIHVALLPKPHTDVSGEVSLG
jgi:hypothetical protein